MKRLIGIFALLVIVALSGACDGGSNSRKFSGRTWDASLSADQAALERAIISDLMGGIIASTIEPELMSISATKPGDAETSATEKVSISVPLESRFTAVANAYEYSGPLGSGTMTISFHGDTEEINVHHEESRKLRFYPLVIVFSFNQYAYVNSCGREAIVTGELNCRMHGSVARASGIIDALGSCSTGREGLTGTINYRLGEYEEHDVHLQATVRAGGPWHELTSYKFYGNYILDRRWGMIDSIIAEPPGVCVE